MAPCERSELLMVSVQVFGMTSSAPSAEAASSLMFQTFKIKPEAIILGISFLAQVESFMWIIERLSRCSDFI